MKKTPIGHVNCPVCEFADAAVKQDKNGHAYVHCPDCNTQVFTRNDHRDHQLRKRMRPVTVTDTVEPAAPEPTAPAVPAKPAKPTAPPAPPAPEPPAPAKAAKKASWLVPILATGGE